MSVFDYFKREHREAELMAEHEAYDRECEREEREWQKYLEEQQTKTDNEQNRT